MMQDKDNEIMKTWERYKLCACNIGGVTLSKKEMLAIDDLINRQKAEIEKLNVELVGMRGACESYKIHYDNAQAEIESLKAEIVIRDKIIDERGKEVIRHDNAIRSLHKQLDNLKSEARKEFAERVVSRYAYKLYEQHGKPTSDRAILVSDIDKLLAEMESEKE